MGGIAIRLAASASSGNHPATGPDPIESGRATHIPLEYSDDDEMEWNPVHTVPLQRLQISPGRGIIAGGCRCRKANRNPHHRSMLQCVFQHGCSGASSPDLTWFILFLESKAILTRF
ncbi:hypothetical protein B0H14DRAFT_2609274 [Mycena olivaceomarginata]|nr:hypothetical protein B0H14DRAFT_2609274 [Mycena olivaceomarginata]